MRCRSVVNHVLSLYKVTFMPQNQREIQNMRLTSLLVMPRKWVEKKLVAYCLPWYTSVC